MIVVNDWCIAIPVFMILFFSSLTNTLTFLFITDWCFSHHRLMHWCSWCVDPLFVTVWCNDVVICHCLVLSFVTIWCKWCCFSLSLSDTVMLLLFVAIWCSDVVVCHYLMWWCRYLSLSDAVMLLFVTIWCSDVICHYLKHPLHRIISSTHPLPTCYLPLYRWRNSTSNNKVSWRR